MCLKTDSVIPTDTRIIDQLSCNIAVLHSENSITDYRQFNGSFQILYDENKKFSIIEKTLYYGVLAQLVLK